MALSTRIPLRVTSGGDDTIGSGSSDAIKDSSTLSGTTLAVTQSGAGAPNRATVTKTDASAFAGPPVANQDTIMINGALYAIDVVSGDNLTLTLKENPVTAAGATPWGVGGRFLTLQRALTTVRGKTDAAPGWDVHIYVNVDTALTGASAIVFDENTAQNSRVKVVEGYTTTPGDGGRKLIDTASGATATSSVSLTGRQYLLRNLKLTDTGNVSLWYCVRTTGALHNSFENCWGTPNGTAAKTGGAFTGHLGHNFRDRADSFRTTAADSLYGQGWGTNDVRVHRSFTIAHECDNDGLGDTPMHMFCIADTCQLDSVDFPNTGGIELGFPTTTVAGGCTAFNTSYNGGGAGYSLRENQSTINGEAFFGNIAANNAGAGLNKDVLTLGGADVAFHIIGYNDMFGNGSAYLNYEPTDSYDAAPSDKTLDPQFTDAPNQNFAIGANLKAAAAIAFQVGGTTYLDMGAVQRQEPAGGGGETFTGSVVNRGING